MKETSQKRFRNPLESLLGSAFQRARLGGFIRESIRQAVQAVDIFGPSDLNERNLLGVAWLKSHRGPCGNIQPHPKSSLTVESKRAIHFEEMEMGPYLNRAVSSVGDFQFGFTAAFVGDHVARCQLIFTGDHWAPPSIE